MTEAFVRLALFTALPLLLGAAVVYLDRTTKGPVRKAEAFLIPLFLVGVGGSGVSDFIAHVFVADSVPRSLAGEPGSAFQLQVGFASLAIGLLGAVAAERRDGFRVATVGAITVFGLGAALAHLLSIAATGNAVPATLLAVSSLVTPVLLIWFLLAVRRGEEAEPQTIVLRGWMIPLRRGSVAAVGIAATAFAVGNSTGQTVILSLAGIGAAAAVFWWLVNRATSHRVVKE